MLGKTFIRLSARIASAFVVLCWCSLASAEEYVTFSSFYLRTGMPDWLMWLVASIAVFVTITGLVVGVPAIVAAIGTTVGNTAGFSGAAATNYGLALLGGGAIASGGFGIVGGTAVLTVALAFSTEVVYDYAAGEVLARFEQRSFIEASSAMMTLPPPMNTDGTATMARASKALEVEGISAAAWRCKGKLVEWDFTSFVGCVSTPREDQRQRVRNALAEMDCTGSVRDLRLAPQVREQTLCALLHFIDNDYERANKRAEESYRESLRAGLTPTLPAFIAAASSLYYQVPDYRRSGDLLAYAVTAEPGNQLIPVMFATYLDRLSYRLNDRSARLVNLDRVSEIAEMLPTDERQYLVRQTLLSHHLMQLKLAQQRIISLTRSENPNIRDNPKTVEVVQASLEDYDHAVSKAQVLVKRQGALLAKLADHIPPWWKEISDGRVPSTKKDREQRNKERVDSVWRFAYAATQYGDARVDLEKRVSEFARAYEDRRAQQVVAPAKTPQVQRDRPGMLERAWRWLVGKFEALSR